MLSQKLSPALPAWAVNVTTKDVFSAERPSRRPERVRNGQTLDIRRTCRQWMRTSGIRMKYIRKRHYTKPGRSVVLWDISASMAETISLYLPWLHQLVRSSRELGVFAFGVQVAELTQELRQTYSTLLSAMAEMTDIWEGGTSIGTALQDWLVRSGEKWLRGRSTVLIISDGWDSGNTESLTNCASCNACQECAHCLDAPTD